MSANPIIDNLERLLASGRDGQMVRFGLGSEYLKSGRHEVAIEHLRKALQFAPEHSASWKVLGKALGEAGRVDEAVDAYTQGIAVAEANGDKQAAKEMVVFAKRLQRPKPAA
jgi:Tfp pilus assembly protein PilF